MVIPRVLSRLWPAIVLAACALGGGDSELFARSLGIAYLEENAVGEFLLGSRRRTR